ncbi:MAG: AAA family ATPase [Myxococcota bacterium]|jgi:MoxR-like ATPase|nr:AAA family ATPase [Myxococcota bacterium]
MNPAQAVAQPEPLHQKLREQGECPINKKLRRVLAGAGQGLLERELPLFLGVAAVLTGEHLLLLGPPGTAKSMLARRLLAAFGGQRYFERLLTQFTVPEEVFGPLSLRALEQDRYERLVEGYLPTAELVFLDELFKANSAILNALLSALNERVFDNGGVRLHLPLLAVVGASNELPELETLAALYDRFLLRVFVRPVSEQAFRALLELEEQTPSEIEHLSPAELEAIGQRLGQVRLSEACLQWLQTLRAYCRRSGLEVSDRRWRKARSILQFVAYFEGREQVELEDTLVLPYCLAGREETLHRLRRFSLRALLPYPSVTLRERVERFAAGGRDEVQTTLVMELEAERQAFREGWEKLRAQRHNPVLQADDGLCAGYRARERAFDRLFGALRAAPRLVDKPKVHPMVVGSFSAPRRGVKGQTLAPFVSASSKEQVGTEDSRRPFSPDDEPAISLQSLCRLSRSG